MRSAAQTYREIPLNAADFFIGLGARRWEEISPLRDVLLTFLSPDFYLLLFSATSEVILIETAFIFKI
jgi:hypothetical protein